MILKCKRTHRFLCEIHIEDYIKNLERLGISQQIPLRVVLPCRNCKKIEEYDIYLTHYEFKRNVPKK